MQIAVMRRGGPRRDRRLVARVDRSLRRLEAHARRARFDGRRRRGRASAGRRGRHLDRDRGGRRGRHRTRALPRNPRLRLDRLSVGAVPPRRARPVRAGGRGHPRAFARAEPRDHGAGRGTVLAWSVPGASRSSDDGGRGCRDRVARVHRGQRRQPQPADRGGGDRRRRRLGRLSRGGRGVCSRAWRAISCGPDACSRSHPGRGGRRSKGDRPGELPVDGGAAGVGRCAVLRRGYLDASRSALHAARLRLLGRPGVAHDLARAR